MKRRVMKSQNNEAYKKYLFAIEANGASYWEYNFQTENLTLSPQINTLLGYDTDKTIGLVEWLTLVHPTDIDRFINNYKQIIQEKIEHFVYEYRVLKADGSYIWIRERGSIYSYDAQGTPLLIVGTHADMTNAKNIYDSFVLNQDLSFTDIAISNINDIGIGEQQLSFWTNN